MGGLEHFIPYMKDYVKTFTNKSITTEQWREHLFDWFGKQEKGEDFLKKLKQVDWDGWFYGTGLDLCVDMQYDDSLSRPPTQLAERWAEAAKKGDFSAFKPEDVKDFDSTQKCVMLDHLYELGPKFQAEVPQKLDELYGFNKTQNAEIKLRFFKVALQSSPEYCESAAGKPPRVAEADLPDWVITKGRMKFCRVSRSDWLGVWRANNYQPIFRLINEQNPELAKKVFKKHAEFYVSDMSQAVSEG